VTAELNALIVAAASIGFFHTLLGPDHYVPFAMMSWSRKWSWSKTALITLLCGLGHIAGSVILGLVGVSLGWLLSFSGCDLAAHWQSSRCFSTKC
jgi:hypothetical protein